MVRNIDLMCANSTIQRRQVENALLDTEGKLLQQP